MWEWDYSNYCKMRCVGDLNLECWIFGSFIGMFVIFCFSYFFLYGEVIFLWVICFKIFMCKLLCIDV